MAGMGFSARPVRFGPLRWSAEHPGVHAAAHPGSPPITGRDFRHRVGQAVKSTSSRPCRSCSRSCSPPSARCWARRTPQIKRSGQRGRERAIVGLTISYVIIVLAVIALVIWLLIATPPSPRRRPERRRRRRDIPRFAATSTHHGLRHPRPSGRRSPWSSCGSATASRSSRRSRTRPEGPETNVILIFPVRCEVRDGVFRVDQILSTSACPGQTLFNKQTVFACISDFRG